MSRKRAPSLERLLFDARWAIDRELSPRDLEPMLEKLLAAAPAGSPAQLFGLKHLARIIAHEQPWRAATLARRVIAAGDDDLAFAVLGLAHSLLGNYRAALRAYTRAAQLAPGCPVVAHNLGHLLDAGLDRPGEALPYLERAHTALPNDVEIAVSYAHALVRSGERPEAERVLASVLSDRPEEVDRLLTSWAGESALVQRSATAG